MLRGSVVTLSYDTIEIMEYFKILHTNHRPRDSAGGDNESWPEIIHWALSAMQSPLRNEYQLIRRIQCPIACVMHNTKRVVKHDNASLFLIWGTTIRCPLFCTKQNMFCFLHLLGSSTEYNVICPSPATPTETITIGFNISNINIACLSTPWSLFLQSKNS